MSIYSEKESREICSRYDIAKVLRALMSGKINEAGYEGEVSQDFAKRSDRTPQGFLIPDCVLERAFSDSHLIGVDSPTNWLGALLAKSVLGKAGATTFTGCRGDLSFRRGGDISPYWVTANGGEATEVVPAFRTVTSTPKTVGCVVNMTRTLSVQTSPDVQDYIWQTIGKCVSLGVEKAALGGSGADGQPQGIDGKEGVHTASFTAGAPTRSEIVAAWASVAADNADGESFAFVAPSAVKAKLLTSTDGHGRYLCERGAVCDLGPLYDTNNATPKKLYCGDWSKLLVSAWSGVDLIFAPIMPQGGKRVVALMDCDITILEPQAFAVGQVLA